MTNYSELKMRPVPEILATIEETLGKADSILWQASKSGDIEFEPGDKELIRDYLDRAFLQTMFLLEVSGHPRMLSQLEERHRAAKQDYSAIQMTPDLDPYLTWSNELRQFLSAIEATLGEPRSALVSRDVVDILSNCQYAITDPCFPEPPKGEAEVHERIEAVLKCLFPNLKNQPSVTKAIKNFEPDTGLPTLRTLIEYKFISDAGDAKRVADEVLADTRGYISEQWDRFIYVIYETHRIKPESEWNELMRASGVGENTKVVVLAGEPAGKGTQAASPGKSKSAA